AGEYRSARREAEAIVATAKTLGYQPLIAEALFRLASVEDLDSDPLLAERDYTEAILLGEASHDDRVVALARVDMVWMVGVRRRRVEEARLLAREAEAALRRIGGDAQLEGSLLVDRALLEDDDHPEEAQRLYRLAIERLAGSTRAPERLVAGRAESNLGDLLVAAQRPAEALEHFDRALANARPSLGIHHPATLLIPRNPLIPPT